MSVGLLRVTIRFMGFSSEANLRCRENGPLKTTRTKRRRRRNQKRMLAFRLLSHPLQGTSAPPCPRLRTSRISDSKSSKSDRMARRHFKSVRVWFWLEYWFDYWITFTHIDPDILGIITSLILEIYWLCYWLNFKLLYRLYLNRFTDK